MSIKDPERKKQHPKQTLCHYFMFAEALKVCLPIEISHSHAFILVWLQELSGMIVEQSGINIENGIQQGDPNSWA
jgi:phosphopantetheinyl transferase